MSIAEFMTEVQAMQHPNDEIFLYNRKSPKVLEMDRESSNFGEVLGRFALDWWRFHGKPSA